MARFRATYEGNGRVTLYCPRCDTHESGIRLDRVHDHAKGHADWWHKPLGLPSLVSKLSIIDLREKRRLA